MAVIEIEERTAAALREQANVRGLSLEEFLQRIAEAGPSLSSNPPIALAEIERSIDELATDSPVLPSDFSRAAIYSDHD